jgi:hypothetical protein
MRKLFWGCLAGSVLLAGSVISTAHFAVRHPDSVAGRVLHGASYAAGIINPVSGFGSLVAEKHAEHSAEEAGQPIEKESVPSDPVPILEDAGGALSHGEPVSKVEEPEPVVVANTGGSAPIVIHEEEQTLIPPAHTPSPVPEDYPCESFAQAECPASATGAAPATMPQCEEDEEYELLPMPRIDAETLPMPTAEEQENGIIDPSKEVICPFEEVPFDCRHKDENPCCPHHCQPSGEGTPGGEEASEAVKAVRRKLSIFKTTGEDGCLEHPDVDTMEFRPSDRHLYDYGPGPL